mmetsp:Transcript_79678/g.234394  ORF Transcript_79678/g.234394 Transcript_79678/m.234394 type:complete len:246 (-) Transcript_79678:310-1047(-)
MICSKVSLPLTRCFHFPVKSGLAFVSSSFSFTTPFTSFSSTFSPTASLLTLTFTVPLSSSTFTSLLSTSMTFFAPTKTFTLWPFFAGFAVPLAAEEFRPSPPTPKSSPTSVANAGLGVAFAPACAGATSPSSPTAMCGFTSLNPSAVEVVVVVRSSFDWTPWHAQVSHIFNCSGLQVPLRHASAASAAWTWLSYCAEIFTICPSALSIFPSVSSFCEVRLFSTAVSFRSLSCSRSFTMRKSRSCL